MVRAFLALSLSAEERRLIQQAVEPLSLVLGDEVRWLRPENWHITLRFLGNVDNNILDYMSQCAESAASEIKKFTYAGQKIAGFPATKSRMIAVYIESNAVLEQLFQTLDQAAIAAGLASENRSFKPHITLAKTREQIKSFSPILLEDFCFTAKELVLYESQSTNEDSHYIPIKKFAFR